MGLLERIGNRLAGQESEQRYSIDTWISEYLIPGEYFTYGGVSYPFGQGSGLNQTLTGTRPIEVTESLPGYTAALRKSPPAFAAQMVRALILSQARFTFRSRPWSQQGKKTFGTSALSILEKPWPYSTTGELLAKMEWHAGLAGNSYVHKKGDRLRVLRPDWVGVIWGSESEPESIVPGHELDGELLGFAYWPGGLWKDYPHLILADEAAWWSPIPDPESPGMGMSWLTPAIRDLVSDRIMTDHKIRYFENGASPNLVIKGLTAATQTQFNALVDMLEERHAGSANAYRTLYLSAGADATVVGSNLGDLDFKGVQGASETRISVLSRVPAPILGIAEGLAGSSLNAGNFGQARRNFADGWVMPTLQNVANALSPLVAVPFDAELWPDTSDIGFLREDAKDAAEIEQIKAATIRQLVDGGFEPSSVINAVTRQDMTLLRHTGMVSVQLLPPGTGNAAPMPNGQAPNGQGQVPSKSL